MGFRRRTYPEVLTNLLTTLTGGVSAEAHPFPPPESDGKTYTHFLEKTAVSEIVSVYGTRNGESFQFRNNTDFVLGNDSQSLKWKDGAQLPDAGSVIHINYRCTSASPILTDINTGSIIRTVSESISLEIARLYAQLDAVYKAGYIDTAQGSSLEKVVSILGINRVPAGKACGEVQFTRAPGNRGAITIPSGTRIIDEKGNVEYQTTETVTMSDGQNTIRVAVRDLEDNDPVEAETLTVIPIPITGIASVTNPAPTVITTSEETDVQLRDRTKNFLHGSERATLGALEMVLKKQGILADIVENETTPGYVTITPHSETITPEAHQRLLQAVKDVRPAGVIVTVTDIKPPAKVNLILSITTVDGLIEQDLRNAQQQVSELIQDYFKQLPLREKGSVSKIIGIVLSVESIKDVKLVEASWEVRESSGSNPVITDVYNREEGVLEIAGNPTVLGEIKIIDPALPTVVKIVVNYPEAASPPDLTRIKDALSNTLSYLNSVNSEELEDSDDRGNLSFGKLLYCLPLPGKSGATSDQSEISLSGYDTQFATGTPPSLPDENSIKPYSVECVIVQDTGMSKVLSASTDPAYRLTAYEQLSLGAVEIQQEDGNEDS